MLKNSFFLINNSDVFSSLAEFLLSSPPSNRVASDPGPTMFRYYLLRSLATFICITMARFKLRTANPLKQVKRPKIDHGAIIKRPSSRAKKHRSVLLTTITRALKTMSEPKFKLVQAVNELGLKEFLELYGPKNALCLPPKARDVKDELELVFATPAVMSYADLEACLGLIEESSAQHYRMGDVGWHPAHKREELRLLDLKYLLVKGKVDAQVTEKRESDVEGFMSFMITYEDGIEVVYCYEIHLSEGLRGTGLGGHFMRVLEDIGRNVGVKKSMLTVFKSNKKAVGFYYKLGYILDEFSPQPTVLRSGKVKEPSYLLLSKPLKHEEGDKYDDGPDNEDHHNDNDDNHSEDKENDINDDWNDDNHNDAIPA
jgi:N-alpha-acetyltransferase 40